MTSLIFAIFVTVPILEIALLLKVGGLIGFFPTIAIIILTAVAGTYLLRIQGLSTIKKLKASLDKFEPPLKEVFDGACLLIAGFVLLTPGFFTDTIGFLLFIPFVRDNLRQFLAKYIDFAVKNNDLSQNFEENDDFYKDNASNKVIDVKFEDIDDKKL